MKEAAILFAQHGASVVVSDLDAAKSDAVAKEIVAAGGKAISVPGDVTDPAFPETILKRTVQTFGKVNHVVNNGIVSVFLVCAFALNILSFPQPDTRGTQ